MRLVEWNFVPRSCSFIVVPLCNLLREGTHDLYAKLWLSVNCFQVVNNCIVKLESKITHRLRLAITEPSRKGSSVHHAHMDTCEAFNVLGITSDCILESFNRSIVKGSHSGVEINYLIASFPGINKSHHVVNVKLKLIVVFKLWTENQISHNTSRVMTDRFEKLAVL